MSPETVMAISSMRRPSTFNRKYLEEEETILNDFEKLKIAKDALGYYNNNDILTFEQQSIAEKALKKINE